ncbi:Protein Y52B11A.3 a [Aphelenchoides avenae]|nr:Protein Y52B11A.3 a [Aphelenchus avenae]
MRARAPQSRNIVKLKPGRGIMDWTRLAAGKQFASATLPFVDEVELSRHDTVNDCWILLFGMVYDVTVYLEYHPGGVDELMRAAGTDASDLFNEYHQWVNYRSMLSSCVVGPFKGSVSKLRKPDNANGRTSNGIATPRLAPLRAVGIKTCRLGPKGLIIDFLQVAPPLECVVFSATKNALRILLRPYASEMASLTFKGIELEKKFSAFREEHSIRVEFDEPFGSLDVHDVTVDLKPARDYYNFEIVKVATINYNCKIYSLRAPASLLAPVPLGHHIMIRLWKKANLILRPYTPISSITPTTSGGSLDFLVKIYDDGIFTPALDPLSEGDIVEVSDPIGDRDIARLTEEPTVLMFAAGTGLTPMVSIIMHRFASSIKER